MNGRSNFPSPRFSSGTPRNDQPYMRNQPYYLQPNCPYLSPRGSGSKMSSPRHSSSGSPDFIPIGISSPVGRPQIRGQWNQRNHSNSSFSGMSTPPSSDSSPNFSPYRRNNFRGRFRGKKPNFNPNLSSSSNSTPIELYIDREVLQDPWARLENKLKQSQYCVTPCSSLESQETVGSTVDSDEDESDTGREEEDDD